MRKLVCLCLIGVFVVSGCVSQTDACKQYCTGLNASYGLDQGQFCYCNYFKNCTSIDKYSLCEYDHTTRFEFKKQ